MSTHRSSARTKSVQSILCVDDGELTVELEFITSVAFAMSNESVMVAIAADEIDDFSEKFSTNKNERLKFTASISVTSKTTVHSALNSFGSVRFDSI